MITCQLRVLSQKQCVLTPRLVLSLLTPKRRCNDICCFCHTGLNDVRRSSLYNRQVSGICKSSFNAA